ncbi:nucleotidyltransferase family protein (plasmid) [Tistrella bauzanensis]|uniref:nucleotidyltransferase domain-containing protein n=1 Tax=Tistrella bauzanensis TaxID=657419 RepID=UPI001E3F1869|nr:nucleotidyltransferase family protein [Tistrella bauzanensis]
MAVAVAQGIGGPVAAASRPVDLGPDGVLGDWGEAARLLARHRVQGLASPALLKAAGHAMPAHLKGNLIRATMLAIQAQRKQMDLLLQVLTALQARGIRAMALKGTMLGHRYMVRPELRLSNDLDVLVDPARIDEAEAVIAGLNYRRFLPPADWRPAWVAHYRKWRKDSGFLAREGGTMIECHWRIFDNWKLLPFDFDSLWQGRHIEQVDGVEIPMIGNLLQLVYLAAHGSYHAWFRLKWVADFAAVFCATSPEDRRVAAALAREMGVGPVFDHALSLAHRLFAIPLTPEETDRVAHAPRRAALDTFALEALHHHDASAVGLAKDRRFALRMVLHSYRLRREPGFLVTQIALDLNFPGGLETSRLGDRWLWLYPAIRGWRSARHHITHRLGWHSAT